MGEKEPVGDKLDRVQTRRHIFRDGMDDDTHGHGLYGGLDVFRPVDQDLVELNRQLTARVERLEKEAARLRSASAEKDQRIEQLEKDSRVMRKQKQVLLHNLAVLFKTATLELERKRNQLGR